jgi:hypothetical protein
VTYAGASFLGTPTRSPSPPKRPFHLCARVRHVHDVASPFIPSESARKKCLKQMSPAPVETRAMITCGQPLNKWQPIPVATHTARPDRNKLRPQTALGLLPQLLSTTTKNGFVNSSSWPGRGRKRSCFRVKGRGCNMCCLPCCCSPAPDLLLKARMSLADV